MIGVQLTDASEERMLAIWHAGQEVITVRGLILGVAHAAFAAAFGDVLKDVDLQHTSTR